MQKVNLCYKTVKQYYNLLTGIKIISMSKKGQTDQSLPPNLVTPAQGSQTQEKSTVLPQAMLVQSDIFPATPAAQLDEGILRVVTYNIHKGVRGIGPTKRAEHENLALAMESFDADLIFLEEVRKLYNRADLSTRMRLQAPQSEILAPEGYISCYMTNAYNSLGQHGNALLSRWPVLEMRREDISNSKLEQRGLLYIKVKVEGRILHCIVTHLSLGQTSRDWQVTRLLDMVKREIPPQDPVLIAGDFNDWNNKLSAAMLNAGFNSFSQPNAPTFPSFSPIWRLDRIYVRGLEPISSYVPKGKIWARMSDHLPLIGNFKWKDSA